jgi:hypothetical protein
MEPNAILVMLEKGVHGNLQRGEIPGAYPMNAFSESIGISRAEPLAS